MPDYNFIFQDPVNGKDYEVWYEAYTDPDRIVLRDIFREGKRVKPSPVLRQQMQSAAKRNLVEFDRMVSAQYQKERATAAHQTEVVSR